MSEPSLTLADRLSGVPEQGNRGGRCSIAVLRNSVDPATQQVLDKMLTEKRGGDSYRWSASALAIALRPEGIAEQTIRRHRQGACQCEKRG